MKEIVQRIALLVFLLALPMTGAGQSTAPTPAPPSAEIVQAQEQQEMAFPVRDTAPRLQRAYLHVFLAFGIAWVLLLIYAVSLGNRFKRLERDLERLRRS